MPSRLLLLLVFVAVGADGRAQVPFARLAIGPGSARVDGGFDADGDAVPDFLVTTLSPSPPPSPVTLHSGANGAVLRSFAPPGPGYGVVEAVLLPDADGDTFGDPAIVWASNGLGTAIVYSGRTGALISTLAPPPAGNARAIRRIRDITTDGADDFVLLHFLNNSWVVEFRDSVTLSVATAIVMPAGAFAGVEFHDVGDFDGDGRRDYAAGSRIWSGTALSPLVYTAPASWFTQALRPVGDVNADGYGDAGAFTNAEQSEAGFAIVFGSATGLHPVGGPGGPSRRTIAALGDLDGDGRSDYGLQTSLPFGGVSPSRLDVISGATDARLYTLEGEAPCDQFGWEAAPIGDVDSDGRPDFAVVARPDSCGGPPGPAYVRVFRSNPILLARGYALGPGFGGTPPPPGFSAAGCPLCTDLGREMARIGRPFQWSWAGMPIAAAPTGGLGYVFAGLPAAAPIVVGPGSAIYFDLSQPYLVFSGVVHNAGYLDFQYSIPDAPVLAGARLAVQAFYPDAASPLGWQGSYGLGLTLGYGW